MKQLLQSLTSRKISLADASVPSHGAHDVPVRTSVSRINPGTETLMIEMGQESLVGNVVERPDFVSLACQDVLKGRQHCIGHVITYHKRITASNRRRQANDRFQYAAPEHSPPQHKSWSHRTRDVDR